MKIWTVMINPTVCFNLVTFREFGGRKCHWAIATTRPRPQKVPEDMRRFPRGQMEMPAWNFGCRAADARVGVSHTESSVVNTNFLKEILLPAPQQGTMRRGTLRPPAGAGFSDPGRWAAQPWLEG